MKRKVAMTVIVGRVSIRKINQKGISHFQNSFVQDLLKFCESFSTVGVSVVKLFV